MLFESIVNSLQSALFECQAVNSILCFLCFVDGVPTLYDPFPGILAYGCTVCDKGFAWELNGLEMLSSVDLEELYPPQKGRPPADVVIQGLGTYRSPP